MIDPKNYTTSPSRPTRRPVGITKGPGETTHEYTFVSRDDEQVLKNGEYVYYELSELGEPGLNGNTTLSRRVLGRIIKRVPLRLYPDTFINPWIPPQSGKQIFLADDEMLASILSLKRAGQNGSATIGSLLTRPPDAVPVVLSVKDLVSTHLAIIASTGAGKSYLASVIIEELMQPYNKACVLILDPHGEYGTLSEIANAEQFSEESKEAREGIGRGGSYRAQVRVYKPDQVKVRLSSLNIGDMRHLLSEMTEKQQYLLNRALRKVNETKRGTPWGSEDLKAAVKSVAKQKGEEDSEGADDSSTVHALMWRIADRFDNSFTFDDIQHLDLPEIFKPGQCTVLQLNDIDERDQQVVVASLLRRLYRARMDTERGKAHSGESYLPYPVFVLLEEAHHFAPGGTDVVSTSILKQVLAEGRKFGIGVGLISQRPGKLNADVLSQCQTQCIMRIV